MYVGLFAFEFGLKGTPDLDTMHVKRVDTWFTCTMGNSGRCKDACVAS